MKGRIVREMRVEWSMRRSKLKRKVTDSELSEVAKEIGELEDLLRTRLDFYWELSLVPSALRHSSCLSSPVTLNLLHFSFNPVLKLSLFSDRWTLGEACDTRETDERTVYIDQSEWRASGQSVSRQTNSKIK